MTQPFAKSPLVNQKTHQRRTAQNLLDWEAALEQTRHLQVGQGCPQPAVNVRGRAFAPNGAGKNSAACWRRISKALRDFEAAGNARQLLECAGRARATTALSIWKECRDWPGIPAPEPTTPSKAVSRPTCHRTPYACAQFNTPLAISAPMSREVRGVRRSQAPLCSPLQNGRSSLLLPAAGAVALWKYRAIYLQAKARSASGATWWKTPCEGENNREPFITTK